MIAVDLIGDIYSPSGYSAHNRELATALEPYVDLRTIDRKHDAVNIDMPLDRFEFFQKLSSKTRDPQVRIEFHTPEFYEPKEGVVNIGFTQWETTGIYDQDTVWNYRGNPEPATGERFNWVKQMNRMDMIFTACNTAKDAFVDSGVTTPVHVIPGPMDTEYYKPGIEENSLFDLNIDRQTKEWIPRSERPVVIGCIAQWTIRKNLEALITAVLSRFKREEVTLLLKVYGGRAGDRRESERLYDKVRRMRNIVNNRDAPRIVMVTENLTDQQVANLYHSMDIYCSTSRGEGYCMPIVQAMSSGVVPVSCAFSAPGDYIEHYNGLYHGGDSGFLVDYTLAPAVGQTHTPWYTHKQDWGEVDVGDLIKQLKSAIDTKAKKPEVWKKLQDNARDTVIRRMSHDVIAQRATHLIEQAVQLVRPGA